MIKNLLAWRIVRGFFSRPLFFFDFPFIVQVVSSCTCYLLVLQIVSLCWLICSFFSRIINICEVLQDGTDRIIISIRGKKKYWWQKKNGNSKNKTSAPFIVWRVKSEEWRRNERPRPLASHRLKPQVDAFLLSFTLSYSNNLHLKKVLIPLCAVLDDYCTECVGAVGCVCVRNKWKREFLMCEFIFIPLRTFFLLTTILLLFMIVRNVYIGWWKYKCVCVRVRSHMCVCVCNSTLFVRVVRCVHRVIHLLWHKNAHFFNACNKKGKKATTKLNAITPSASCRLFARIPRIKCKCLWWKCAHKNCVRVCIYYTLHTYIIHQSAVYKRVHEQFYAKSKLLRIHNSITIYIVSLFNAERWTWTCMLYLDENPPQYQYNRPSSI